MIKKTIAILMLLISIVANSQEIKSYTWDEKPVFKAIPDEYKNEAAVVLLDKRWIHTRVGNYAFASFVMNHFAIKINKAEEINKYNKIKAEDNGLVRSLRDFHARIIKPNGEIQVLPKERIVETESDKIKSIVFEGVEAGDILEYYFILKENPNPSGVEIFQKEIPVLEAQFSHSADGAIINTFQSPNFTYTSSGRVYTYTATNIAPFKEEKYATNIKNLVKLIYLVYTPAYDNYNWRKYFLAYYTKPKFQYFKKNQAREFIENLDIKDISTEEKMVKIDNYIKENFDFVWNGEKANKVTDLNDGKQKLKAGDIFDLYAFAFKELKIPYQVVAGMSRYMGDVDNDFYVMPLNHEFMYYIPETKKFISPYEKYLSYGYPMYEIQGSHGVAYDPKEKVVSNQFYFPTAPADYTVNETKSTITLSKDLSEATIEKTYSNSGYEGQLDRNRIRYYKENKEEKDLKEYFQNRIFGEDSGLKLENYKLSNEEFKYNQDNTPFIVNTNATANEGLVDKAGKLVLINLGKIIGKQSNLYQETQRTHDIAIDYTKTYKHKIVFNIPAGYVVESYKDLVIDRKMKGDEAKICSFKSTVTTQGNQLIVAILESYNAIDYPKDQYQEYRNVINAGYDFSKAVLVLKPKK